MITFPPHKGELSLTHNAHRSDYQTAEQWAAGETDWVSDAERLRALETDEVWVLQWYPETPIGFHRVVASTLEAVLQAARDVEAGS